MDAAIIAALVAALVSLLGTVLLESFFRPRSFQRRETAENRRWLLQHYLPLKIANVNVLHTVASEQYLGYRRASKANVSEALSGHKLSEQFVQEKIEEHVKLFTVAADATAVEHAVAAASLFMDEDAREAAEDFALSFRLHVTAQIRKIKGEGAHPELEKRMTDFPLQPTLRKLGIELKRHLDPEIILPIG